MSTDNKHNSIPLFTECIEYCYQLQVSVARQTSINCDYCQNCIPKGVNPPKRTSPERSLVAEDECPG
jgi:hypothetical protein